MVLICRTAWTGTDARPRALTLHKLLGAPLEAFFLHVFHRIGGEFDIMQSVMKLFESLCVDKTERNKYHEHTT